MNGKKAKLIRRHVKNYIGKGCTGKEPVQYRAKKHAPKQVFDVLTGKAKVITPVQIFCAEGFLYYGTENQEALSICYSRLRGYHVPSND